MSTVTFSGLSSGIDTGSLIDQMVSLERNPIRQMETRISDYQSQLSIIQTINSKLQAFQTKATDMSSLKEFLSYSVSSSDEDQVTATATGEASPGAYAVEVTKLATGQRTYSDAFADKELAGAGGVGTLTLTIDSVAVDIDIVAEDTLESIASKINASNAEVSAGLLFTGSEYRLQISGNNTGASNAISFTEGGTIDLGLIDPLNEYQAAQDAALTVDGYAITSASNDVSDAIPGLSLQLHEETTGPIAIKIEADSTETKAKVEELLTAYNSIISIIQAESSYSGEAKGQDRLTGDSTIRGLQMQMATTMVSQLTGLTGNFTSLSQIGISTNSNGQMSLDSEDFDAALASDAVGVAQVFSGTADHSAEGLAQKIDSMVDSFIDYSDGILTAKSKGINSTISSLNVSIENFESRVTKYEDKLRKQFTDMEIMMNSLNSQSSFMSGQMGIW